MTTYATWNPADKHADLVLSNGDLTSKTTASSYRAVRATMGKSSGKWYFETTIDANTSITGIGVGTTAAFLGSFVGGDAYGWGYQSLSGYKRHSGAQLVYGAGFTTGDIIGTAFDIDNGEIWWSKNGVWQASGDPVTRANPAFTGLAGMIYPMICHRYTAPQATTNFGASAFSYSVPSGFNSGVYESSSQTELEDTSLDLAAYYQHFDNLKSFLRAHDGIEFRDLQGSLEAAGWNIEDFVSFLSAYYESLNDDAGMDLTTWGTHYDDSSIPLAAWLQHLEDISANLEARYQGFSNWQAFLEAAAFAFKDLRAFFSANGQAMTSLAAWLGAGRASFRNLDLFLYVTNGIVLNNLGCFLFADSGLVQNDMAMFLRVISSVPVFGSVVAQRVSAVVSEAS